MRKIQTDCKLKQRTCEVERHLKLLEKSKSDLIDELCESTGNIEELKFTKKYIEDNLAAHAKLMALRDERCKSEKVDDVALALIEKEISILEMGAGQLKRLQSQFTESQVRLQNLIAISKEDIEHKAETLAIDEKERLKGISEQCDRSPQIQNEDIYFRMQKM